MAISRHSEPHATSLHRSGAEPRLPAEPHLGAAFDRIADGLAVLDRDWCYRYINEPAAELLGRRAEDLIGHNIWDEFPEAAHGTAHRQIARAMYGRATVRFEDYYEATDRWFEDRVYPFEDGVMILFSDITDRKRAEQRARETDDALRRSEARLKAIVDNTPSVIYVKNRDFRYELVNREFARYFGREPDELVGLADEELLPPDAVARVRAEDSVVLETGEPLVEEDIVSRDGESRTYMTVKFALPGVDGDPTAVCGISTDITERRRSEEDLRERMGWSRQVRAALDEGRVTAYGQPILDLGSGAVAREELLVRVRAVDDGVIEPAAFLPHIERLELIEAIDRRMIETALKLAHEGRCVNVNVSALSLCDPGFIDFACEALESAPDAARRLVFEVTETAAVAHMEAAREFTGRLTQLGASIALDDFGTGFGSFTYLRSLPVSYLKIDSTFVRGAATNEHDRRVVRSIVGIAREFGQRTIAEGVEEEETLRILREDGVDFAQGFLIGRPGPIAA